MAITVIAIATGSHTLSHHRQPPSNSGDWDGLAEKTERMILR
jgi:hypothetical protein